jgi:hypothetical protein
LRCTSDASRSGIKRGAQASHHARPFVAPRASPPGPHARASRGSSTPGQPRAASSGLAKERGTPAFGVPGEARVIPVAPSPFHESSQARSAGTGLWSGSARLPARPRADGRVGSATGAPHCRYSTRHPSGTHLRCSLRRGRRTLKYGRRGYSVLPMFPLRRAMPSSRGCHRTIPGGEGENSVLAVRQGVPGRDTARLAENRR